MYARNAGVRVCSWIPVIVVMGIFAFEFVCYNLFVLGYLHRDIVVAGAILFNTPLFMAVWSYLKCAWSDPGKYDRNKFVR